MDYRGQESNLGPGSLCDRFWGCFARSCCKLLLYQSLLYDLIHDNQGRWWFGSRQKTKDGINAQSAAAFFKTITEESSVEEVVSALGKAYQWELSAVKTKSDAELTEIETVIKEQLGAKWTEVRRLAQNYSGELHESRRKALVLLYAHLLRLEVKDAGLKKRAIILCVQYL